MPFWGFLLRFAYPSHLIKAPLLLLRPVPRVRPPPVYTWVVWVRAA